MFDNLGTYTAPTFDDIRESMTTNMILSNKDNKYEIRRGNINPDLIQNMKVTPNSKLPHEESPSTVNKNIATPPRDLAIYNYRENDAVLSGLTSMMHEEAPIPQNTKSAPEMENTLNYYSGMLKQKTDLPYMVTESDDEDEEIKLKEEERDTLGTYDLDKRYEMIRKMKDEAYQDGLKYLKKRNKITDLRNFDTEAVSTDTKMDLLRKEPAPLKIDRRSRSEMNTKEFSMPYQNGGITDKKQFAKDDRRADLDDDELEMRRELYQAPTSRSGLHSNSIKQKDDRRADLDDDELEMRRELYQAPTHRSGLHSNSIKQKDDRRADLDDDELEMRRELYQAPTSKDGMHDYKTRQKDSNHFELDDEDLEMKRGLYQAPTFRSGLHDYKTRQKDSNHFELDDDDLEMKRGLYHISDYKDGLHDYKTKQKDSNHFELDDDDLEMYRELYSIDNGSKHNIREKELFINPESDMLHDALDDEYIEQNAPRYAHSTNKRGLQEYFQYEKNLAYTRGEDNLRKLIYELDEAYLPESDYDKFIKRFQLSEDNREYNDFKVNDALISVVGKDGMTDKKLIQKENYSVLARKDIVSDIESNKNPISSFYVGKDGLINAKTGTYVKEKNMYIIREDFINETVQDPVLSVYTVPIESLNKQLREKYSIKKMNVDRRVEMDFNDMQEVFEFTKTQESRRIRMKDVNSMLKSFNKEEFDKPDVMFVAENPVNTSSRIIDSKRTITKNDLEDNDIDELEINLLEDKTRQGDTRKYIMNKKFTTRKSGVDKNELNKLWNEGESF